MDNSEDNLTKSNTKLAFTVSKCSSYSSTYIPDHIMHDKPWDQTSRWSSDSNTPPQFLVLKLQRISIVESITFGKFEKTHVCNLKKFKVYAGLTEENMTELLESGLKNDSHPERFDLNHQINGYIFPCRYIKIVPLQSWGPSFNFSIWYIEIQGVDDYEIVQPRIISFNNFQEREAIRVCLKHLRDHNYLDAFDSLQKKTRVQLEHPKMTELHNLLVLKGDFSGTEKFLEDCSDTHLFYKFIIQQDYKGTWTQILADPDLEHSGADSKIPLKPRMRGGHQMCIDVDAEQIYLFGGWDGYQDLSDFWSYNIPLGTWTLISESPELEGGPSARSCHKMVLDQEHRQIFILGRFLDIYCRIGGDEPKSDFYVYDIESKKWTLISDDTHAYGGPELIFDHQMCIDSTKSLLYVFGGRILGGHTGISDALPLMHNTRDGEEETSRFPDPMSPSALSMSSQNSEQQYSGLYSYHISTNTWTLIRSDVSSENLTPDRIKSRVGHSMLFHKDLRKLYIFAGQRSKEFLNDFFSYDVDRDEIEIISDGMKGANPVNSPSGGFTQRATIDSDLNELYIFSGVTKREEKREETVHNSFWVYDIRQSTWSCIYRNDGHGMLSDGLPPIPLSEPCPRFAHQLVYDHNTKVHYIFGGNPGRQKDKDPKLRLDDFWRLRLDRPAQCDVLRECKLMLRKQRFEELVSENSLDALLYLQTSLSELVNHSDPVQSKDFQKLSHLLFSNDGEDVRMLDTDDPVIKEDKRVLKRSQIFDKLVRFFPEEMTQPKINLIDLLSF